MHKVLIKLLTKEVLSIPALKGSEGEYQVPVWENSRGRRWVGVCLGHPENPKEGRIAGVDH